MLFMGRGFTSRGQGLKSVFSKAYVESLPLVLSGGSRIS